MKSRRVKTLIGAHSSLSVFRRSGSAGSLFFTAVLCFAFHINAQPFSFISVKDQTFQQREYRALKSSFCFTRKKRIKEMKNNKITTALHSLLLMILSMKFIGAAIRVKTNADKSRRNLSDLRAHYFGSICPPQRILTILSLS